MTSDDRGVRAVRSPSPPAWDDRASSTAENATEETWSDVVFEALSSPRRRFVVQYLQREGGAASVGELARAFVASERSIPVADVDTKDRKRIYTSLYQVHLPSLAAAGFVEYDRENGIVSRGQWAAHLEAHLRLSAGTRLSRPWLSLALGTFVGTLVTAVVAVFAAGASPLSVAFVLGCVTLLLAVSATRAVLLARTDPWPLPATPAATKRPASVDADDD